MARGQPRPQRHLKILDKLKIITLYEKEAGMPMRKFTDLVEIKLGLKVGRSTIQRIVKIKEELLAIPEHYRTTRILKSRQTSKSICTEISCRKKDERASTITRLNVLV